MLRVPREFQRLDCYEMWGCSWPPWRWQASNSAVDTQSDQELSIAKYMQQDVIKTGEPVANEGAPFRAPSGEVKLYRKLALSDHWFPRTLRWALKAVRNLSVPAPRLLAVPFAVSIVTGLSGT